MRPARTAGGIQREANKRGIVSNLNEPKTTHNIINSTMASTAKTTPTMLALVRFCLFTGEGELVIVTPYSSVTIISKVGDQHSAEVGGGQVPSKG